MTQIATENYSDAAQKAVCDPVLRRSLYGLYERFGRPTARAYLDLPEGPQLRLTAHDIRMRSIERLDILIPQIERQIVSNGGNVLFANDADEAVSYCLKVAKENHVQLITKGKSMVTEEIGLNPAMQEHGIEVFETD